MKTTLSTTNNIDTASQTEVTFKNYPFQHDYPDLEAAYDYPNKALTSNMNKIDFVVTHGHCSDGYMSSTIVRMYLKSIGVDLTTVTFFDGYHNADFSKLPEMMQDKYVVVCDFSFPKLIFDKMITATNGNILVLDHHKSALEALPDVDPKYLTFDMNHSGAFITWTYFFGFTGVPKAVLYVEDNDIWTKKLPQTREFTAYMFSVEFDFDAYERFFDDQYLIEQAFPIGTGMVLQNKAYLKDLTKSCIPRFVQTPDKRYYFIACIDSAGILRSDLGNFVLSEYPNANLSMVYSHNQYNNSTSVSYRSLDDRTDSTEIAKLNGGGGHRNASGASIAFKVDNPPGRLIDPYRAYFMLDDLYEEYVNEYYFLALNASTTKKHLVKYLMQQRFINKDGEFKNRPRTSLTQEKLWFNSNTPYQEGLYCMKTKRKDPQYDCAYTGAYAWHYDGHIGCYKTIIKLAPNTSFISKNILEIGDDNSNVKIKDLGDNLFEIETFNKITPSDILREACKK